MFTSETRIADNGARTPYLDLEVDRDTLLSLNHVSIDDPRWTFGSVSQDETRRRLAENDPTDEQRAAYRVARDAVAIALADTFTLATSKRRRRVRSDDGDVIDVSQYLSDPERGDFWLRMTPDTRPHRIVRVALDCSYSCETSLAVIQRYGALAAAVVDALGASGIAAQVDLIQATSAERFSGPIGAACSAGGRRGWFVARTPWAEAFQPLDEGALSTLGLPGLLRNHGFGLMDEWCKRNGGRPEHDTPGYGRAATWPTGFTEALGYDVAVGAKWSEGSTIEQLRGVILGGEYGIRNGTE